MRAIAVMPAYNEAEKIEETINGTLKTVDELVVIDDGSTDNTREKVEAMAKTRRIKLITNGVNRGKGYSLRKGFEYAMENGYDLVVTIDSDMEHDPQEIPKLVEKAVENDLVVAQRNIYRSPARRVLNLWSTLWVRLLIPKVEDTQCGFRAIKTNLLKKMELTKDDYSIELEMLLEARKNNAKIATHKTESTTVSKTKVRFSDYLRINDTYDTWIIKNHGKIRMNPLKRSIILSFARIGLLLSWAIRLTIPPARGHK